MFLLARCTPPGDRYSEYRELPAEGWIYGDTIEFVPQFADSIATGQLIVAVTHDNDFPYSSLWLEVSSTDPAGKHHSDTLHFPLADSFGRWQSRGLGSDLQMADTVARKVTLASGKPLGVRHIMKTDTLRYVSHVGIFFLPGKNNMP